ncbi:MAG: hypothetical protein WA989_03255 [Henriciella sp.]|uniref:N-acyl amino acid synthase FeeM domain-containing protein n=1 Tax=Henriciella sp. TaxID=1968823 RepID=UPI003C781FDA
MNVRVLEALRRTQYSVVNDDAGLEEVCRLRYQCYRAEGAIGDSSSQLMSDPFDETENCVHVAVKMDGTILASVRLHLATPLAPISPTLDVFPEVRGSLDEGKTVLDPTRFVVDPSARRDHVPLHFLTLRVAVLATMFYDVDLAVAPVRAEHVAFYNRYLGYRTASEPREYPGLRKPVRLLMSEGRTQRQAVLERTPVFGPVDEVPGADIDFPPLLDIRPRPDQESVGAA